MKTQEKKEPADYFSAYRARLEKNDEDLRKLGEELKNMGFKVRIWESRKLISAINIYSPDLSKGVRLQFNEVPYRWTLEYDTQPNIKTGSGFHREERFNLEEIPFTAHELVNSFLPMFIDKRFSHH